MSPMRRASTGPICSSASNISTADLAPLEAHLGFRLGPVPRVNQSNRGRDWRAYYGDSEAEIVAELCETDIKRFGYSFS